MSPGLILALASKAPPGTMSICLEFTHTLDIWAMPESSERWDFFRLLSHFYDEFFCDTDSSVLLFFLFSDL